MPDGFGDFVDALNNPKEFLSREEKRLKQLQDKLGIDEKEISEVPCEKKSSKLAHSSVHADSSKKSTSLNNDQKKGKDRSRLSSQTLHVDLN